MHFRISSSLSFKRKTKRHVFLLLFVLTTVHLNWPSYATGKCNQSPRQLISTMKHWWLYITIHSLTIFKWKRRNLRLNLIYLSFFVQYILGVLTSRRHDADLYRTHSLTSGFKGRWMSTIILSPSPTNTWYYISSFVFYAFTLWSKSPINDQWILPLSKMSYHYPIRGVSYVLHCTFYVVEVYYVVRGTVTYWEI